jgi:hypothetical protein
MKMILLFAAVFALAACHQGDTGAVLYIEANEGRVLRTSHQGNNFTMDLETSKTRYTLSCDESASRELGKPAVSCYYPVVGQTLHFEHSKYAPSGFILFKEQGDTQPFKVEASHVKQ